MNIIDTPTSHALPERAHPPSAIIIHTTGDTDLDKVLDWYTDRRGNNTQGLAPHYMIELTGVIRRIVEEGRVAYHCKIDPSEKHLYQLGYGAWSKWGWKSDRPFYMSDEFSGYRQWRDDWQPQGVSSPLDLVTGEHPNFASVGVELLQPKYPEHDIFTDLQYAALAELLVDVGKRCKIPLDRQHVLGHYDCSPMRRCTASGSYDPGRDFNFNRVWDAIRALSPRV